MRITRPLEQAMRGSVAVPVIIRVKQEYLRELRNHLLFDFKITGLSIPRFNMFAAVLPDEAIDQIMQLNFVETVYLDREVRIPEIKGAEVTFEPIRRLLFRAREMRARKAVTIRKPEWIPTSESRKMLEADVAQREGYEGRDVKIAVVDTDSSRRYAQHIQLRGRVIGYSVIPEKSDKNGHGGHCSTTALGGEYISRLLGLKAWGVAPKASGLGVKVLRGATGMGSTSDVIKGVEYAVQWGAQVINLSLGGSPTADPKDDPFYPVFEEIKDKLIVCAAIGNDGPNPETTNAPGSLPNVIAVGACDIKGFVCDFSSRGSTPDGRIKPDVIAPGKEIWSGITIDTYLDYVSDYLGNAFTAISGTSMATPHASGLLALAVELFEKELPEEKLTTDLVSRVCEMYGNSKSNVSGYGLIKWSWFKR
ncbi:MAG: S8 family serine peptidase, partial [Candidatus Bathyarchaeia archaeon]